jgi:uncharacterized membrane protein YkvA (DUF1232 family)
MASVTDSLLPTASPDAESTHAQSNPLQRAWTWLNDAAGRLKRELVALSLASADPRTPVAAKIWAALVIGYALSPFDLIPDFIPVR